MTQKLDDPQYIEKAREQCREMARQHRAKQRKDRAVIEKKSKGSHSKKAG